jgi:hypothetical protein
MCPTLHLLCLQIIMNSPGYLTMRFLLRNCTAWNNGRTQEKAVVTEVLSLYSLRDNGANQESISWLFEGRDSNLEPPQYQVNE